MSAPHTPSPTGSVSVGPLESGVVSSNGEQQQQQQLKPIEPIMKDVYNTENEIERNLAPTKEEIETNEKNLQQNAAYLGQLVFKLR